MDSQTNAHTHTHPNQTNCHYKTLWIKQRIYVQPERQNAKTAQWSINELN